MINKELLIQAIPHSELYTESESKILQEFVKIAIEEKIIVSAKYLIKLTGLSVTTVYTSLRSLQKDGIIIKLNNEVNSYEFNKEKINQLIQLYQNKQAMEKF